MRKFEIKSGNNFFKKLKAAPFSLLTLAERRGLGGLFFYAIIGSLILPVPIDSALSGLIIASPRRWVRLTSVFTLASVISGLATYGIGLQFINLIGARLISLLGSQTLWQSLVLLFHSNRAAAYLATVSLLAGPYRLSILAAGAAGMKFSLIITILLTTRACRFFAIGVITRFLRGWQAKLWNERKASQTTIFPLKLQRFSVE
jgi:membrane protein YqaA with SNARE-associated domain